MEIQSCFIFVNNFSQVERWADRGETLTNIGIGLHKQGQVLDNLGASDSVIRHEEEFSMQEQMVRTVALLRRR